MTDNVNSPEHYKFGDVELINITEHLSFNRGNVVKYVVRAGVKDKATELEDLRKARWYLDREIDRLEGGTGSGAGVPDKGPDGDIVFDKLQVGDIKTNKITVGDVTTSNINVGYLTTSKKSKPEMRRWKTGTINLNNFTYDYLYTF